MGYSSALDLRQLATPSRTPPAGTTLLYVKSDNKVYAKDSGGTEWLIGPYTGSGLPSGTVPAGDLAGSSYPSPVLANGVVTTAKIADGTILSADEDMSYRRGPVVDIQSASTANVATGAWTAVLGPYTPTVPNAYCSAVSGGIFTMSVAGMFMFICSAGFPAAAVGRRMIRLEKNSTAVRTHDYSGAVGSNGMLMMVSHIMPMAVGDTFTLSVYQASGATLALNGNHEYQIWRLSGETAYNSQTTTWPP